MTKASCLRACRTLWRLADSIMCISSQLRCCNTPQFERIKMHHDHDGIVNKTRFVCACRYIMPNAQCHVLHHIPGSGDETMLAVHEAERIASLYGWVHTCGVVSAAVWAILYISILRLRPNMVWCGAISYHLTIFSLWCYLHNC